MGPEFSLFFGGAIYHSSKRLMMKGLKYTSPFDPAEIPIVYPHFRRQFCTASPSQDEPMKVSRNSLPF